MTRRNRVLPTQEITALPQRGLFMGNRGCLHAADGSIRRPWRLRAWICCRTEFKGRRRAIMAPGRYTELFFLDEAVALAAGHRPCAECRRADYNRFRDAWASAFGTPASAAGMDEALHRSRLDPSGRQRPHSEALPLPDGAFVDLDGIPHLVAQGRVHRFGTDGYGAPQPLPEAPVTVLTPAVTVALLRAGYVPRLHPSLAPPESRQRLTMG
ncbi:MAG: hypothetical protein ACK4KW_03895 [Gemmobacter sp.]